MMVDKLRRACLDQPEGGNFSVVTSKGIVFPSKTKQKKTSVLKSINTDGDLTVREFKISRTIARAGKNNSALSIVTRLS